MEKTFTHCSNCGTRNFSDDYECGICGAELGKRDDNKNIPTESSFAARLTVILEENYPDCIKEVCETLMKNSEDSLLNLSKIIRRKHEKILSDFKPALLDFVIDYIDLSLHCFQLSASDRDDIKKLKIALQIKEGDFYNFKYSKVAQILKVQLQHIYKDKKVSETEAELKLHLQDVFDLSYDQFLEFVNEEALMALGNGGNVEDLDTIFVNGETSAEANRFTRPLSIENRSTALATGNIYTTPSEAHLSSYTETAIEEEEYTERCNRKNKKQRFDWERLVVIPNKIFYLEVTAIAVWIGSQTNLVIALIIFVTLLVFVHFSIFASILAIASSAFVGFIAFKFSNIFFNGVTNWIIALLAGLSLLSKHYFIFQINSPKERSRQISSDVKRAVWQRDVGKCVLCGSNENLEYDHDIPFSKGGANTVNNIRLLCMSCNRQKSNTIQ
jgi:hypothetical protein